MEKIIRRRQSDAPEQWASAGMHPLLARVYAGRGVQTPEELELGLAQLLSPTLLLNAERAAQMLADALAQQRSILIVGDSLTRAAGFCRLRC